MSPTLNGSSVVRACIKLSNVLKIRNAILYKLIFDFFIWDCPISYTMYHCYMHTVHAHTMYYTNHPALGYRGFKHKLIVYEDQPPESNTTTVKTDKVQADCILWGTVRHCGALPTDGARWTNSTTKLKCGCLKQTHSYIPPHHQQPIKIQYIFCSVGNTRVTVKGGKHSVYFKHISSTRRAWQKFNNWKVVPKQLIAAYNQGWSTTMMRHCVSCVALCPPDVLHVTKSGGFLLWTTYCKQGSDCKWPKTREGNYLKTPRCNMRPIPEFVTLKMEHPLSLKWDYMLHMFFPLWLSW